jgi:hypothetical protein
MTVHTNNVVDQIDYFLSLLRRRFGYFTVIQNPSTGVSWPAELFIKTVAPVLWKEERQENLELYFEPVHMYRLQFRADARDFFVAVAEEDGVFLDLPCPRPSSEDFILPDSLL